MSRGKHWVFTLNNYSSEEEDAIRNLSNIEYLVVGREIGESGTPPLQGYCVFTTAIRLSTVRSRLGLRIHAELARGTPAQASTYCKKDGDFFEVGTLPGGRGARNDLREFFEWSDQFALERGRTPTTPEIAREYPVIATRYPRALSVCRLRFDGTDLISGEPKPWQSELEQRLDDEPDDRTVEFIVDVDGGKGKSWFVKYYFSKHRSDTQILGVAKRDDVCHMISTAKRVFFFNVSRGQMEYMQYSVLEMLKDRLVISPKYDSRTKVLDQVPHVVVFSNEFPDPHKLSHDRYKITEL